ncbi:helix-turn-helix domain-containing protein [Leptospira sp. GIMC2001]|uniref:helix-turn-helix domain-containing protein n=1 Tax=Leptospira sp. GIMC2001 TaxID=1513297 RepID=UPI00234B38D8|nr:helix-turn-helix transcriptional regulator [Leptospira sp. GIMC2001]WCL50669.1 helix-turn-helix transcriptional regulator [Leptospira sp. GIMC2001]
MKTKRKYSDFFENAKKTMSSESIEIAKNKANKILFSMKLSDLRKQSGIKQTDIEGFSQTSISRIEGRDDIKLSTLVDYVHALGMEIEIKVINKKKRNQDKEILLMKA